MDIHKNARLSFRSREILVKLVLDQGVTQKAAAEGFRVGAQDRRQVGSALPQRRYEGAF